MAKRDGPIRPISAPRAEPMPRARFLRRDAPTPLSPPEPVATAPSDRTGRQIAFRFGLTAESRAAAFLIAKGYRIAARRFRTRVGEIDIVARRRRSVVFVEVKARETLDDAAEAVTPRQRQRIIAAAEAWLAAHPDDTTCDMRFDVILVAPGRLPRHLPAAFDASA